VKKKEQKNYETLAFTWTKSIYGKYELLKKINKRAYEKSIETKK